jgi:hypothetical protein
MARLVIFGAGDIARLAHHYFTRDSEHQVAAFTVDQEYLKEESFLELPMVAFEGVAKRYPPQDYKMSATAAPFSRTTLLGTTALFSKTIQFNRSSR